MSDSETNDCGDTADDVSVTDPGTRHVLRVGGRAYLVPEGAVRVAIERLTDISECGSLDGIRHDASVETRSLEALAFLYRVFREDTTEGIERVIEEELTRLVKALGCDEKTAAREAYANLAALQGWMGLFYGDFSARFLCEHHQAISRAQYKLALDYQEEDTDDPAGSGARPPLAVSPEAFSKVFGSNYIPKKRLEH